MGADDSGASTMLLEFRATNARSFRDELTFSFLATGLKEADVVREIPWRSGGNPRSVLPALGVFGANGSGKTNLLRIMGDMRALVLESFRTGAVDGGISRQDFKLHSARAEKPTTYEVRVVLEGVQHDYGFTLDDRRILNEWAVYFPHGKEALLFERSADAPVKIGGASKSAGRAIERLLRPNALYLSTAAQAHYEPAMPLYQWFRANLLLAALDNRHDRTFRTAEMLATPAGKAAVLQFIREADLGITDIFEEPPEGDTLDQARQMLHLIAEKEGLAADDLDTEDLLAELSSLKLAHAGEDQPVRFDLQEESMGTQVWLGLIGPTLDALRHGSVLLVDELDASLHPRLVEILVHLFQDRGSNPNNAQLVFNAFDLGLLGDAGQRRLRRDQVWFTEKLGDGASRIYPLSDFNPRKHENIAKGYREGRYGAVPIVSRSGFAPAATPVTCGAAP